MTGKLRHATSTTIGAVPTAMDPGQIFINRADGLMFWKDDAGVIQATTLDPVTQAQLTSEVSALKGAVSSGYDTLKEIEDALGTKAALASPTFTGTPSGPTATGGTNTTQFATTAFVQSALSSGRNVGEIKMCGKSAALTGTLLCDGAAYSRTTYADLFAAIGTAWGVGDGATTFNVPDFRGEFPRGWDNGRGVDSGRVLGSFQAATTHPYIAFNSVPNIVGPSNYFPTNVDASGGSVTRGFAFGTSTSTGIQYYTSRPRNVAANFCIVY